MKQSTFSAVMANSIKNLLQGYTKGIRFVAVLTLLFTMGIGQAWGADVTYTVSKTNAVTKSGTAPTNSTAAYSQTYGTACQITSGNSATLTLTKLGGINISNITLSMKSNKSAGAGKLSYSTDGGSTWTYLVGSSNSTVTFNNASWNGSYTQTYTDISKTVSLSNVTQLKIKIEATTNSLYCQSYKITYTTTGTKVTLTKGSVTNGSISLNKSEVITTSAAQSVTVTCTPNTGYYTKSVSATKPATGNTPTYGGSGNSRTVTYSKGSNGSSTITATFSPQWQLRGTFNNWGATHPLTSFSGSVATVTVDLQARTAYTFKFVNVSGSSEQWYGNSGAIITDISDWEFSTSVGDNARLFTGPAGTYTFKFNVSTKALQVIYPTVTHPAEGYAYFQKQDSWNGFKVYNYTSDIDRLSDWDGSPSVTNTTTICGKTYYYTALATQFQKVIFRDNGSNQWKEISVSGYSGKYCGDDYNATPQTWKTFNKYSITFNSNGGSGSMTALSGICPGESQTLTANSFTRAGHKFNGWNTKADGTGTNYADKASIANINSNITLFAKWKANTYTITSNLTNCSSSPAIPASYTYTGSAANLSYTITAASGYRLPDNITVSGTTYTWNKNTGLLKLTGTINSNVAITITAIKVHTITWMVNGTTHSTTTVDNGDPLVLPSPNPTAPTSCSDKEFMGWTESATIDSEGNNITYINSSTKPDGDKTYHAVFATKDDGEVVTTTDKLTRATTGIDNGSSTYSTWSGKTVTSPAVYAGNSAGSNNSIQLRSNNSNSGIVTTKSGGKVTRVSVVWNSETASGRTLNVYGKNSAYSAATDLYNSSNQGTLLGNIVYGTSTELTISGDYEYIGLRSASNAMYLTSVSITWSVGSEPTYTDYVTSCTPQYTITLNPNGGTFATDPAGWTKDGNNYTITVNEGTQVYLPEPTHANNLDFVGWNDGTTNHTGNYTPTNNVTLTAQWQCVAPTSVTVDGTYHFFPGETITITATPTGGSTPYTYQWQKLVVDAWTDIDQATTATYTKANATKEDVGHYRCVVSSGNSCTTTSNQYNVKCLQLYVYYNDHTDNFNLPLTKLDATTATASVNLVNAGYTYYFKLTDGCEDWYGNTGTMTSGDCTNWLMDANEYCGLTTTKYGDYLFTVDYSDLTQLKVSVTYPSGDQEAGKVIYWDNHDLQWPDGKIYYRIGHSTHNGKIAMTKVPGTANLYQVTTIEYAGFEAWHIANNGCWSEDNSIYKTNTGDDWAATAATAFITNPVTSAAVTVTPSNIHSTGGEEQNNNCEFFDYNIAEGMKKHEATVIPTAGGTITVSYTDHDGTEYSDFTSGDRDLAHTCLLTITATPDAGYKLGTLTVNDVAFTSGNVHTLTEDAVIKVTWTEKANPTFAWSAATCTAALEADNTFPTLSNPNNLSVTYKSSDENVAKIDVNGNVILGTVGETEITATGAETATHKSATTTYKLTVVESNCKWVEVTDNTTLEDGDKVVISMTLPSGTSYLLPNEEVTNAVPEAIKLTNTTSFENPYIWIVDKEGIYLKFESFKYRNKFLTCNNADAGVRVNTGENKIFVIDDTYGYLKNTQTTKPRYLGVHNENYTWYSYALTDAGNFPQKIAGQTLKFYKRECLDSEHYWVTWDAGEGAWTDGSSKKLEFYQVGAAITAPTEEPTREGHRFDGWTPAPGNMSAQNTTFTAKWTQMHTITWMVGSSSVLLEDVANGTGVTQTPSDPLDGAIGSCANKFMGWSETALGSTEGQSAPADLCTAAQMKAKHTSVTGDKTFYAVFATASGTSNIFSRVTELSQLEDGNTLAIVAEQSGGQIFGTESDHKGGAAPVESDGKITISVSTNKWILEEVDGGWKLLKDENNKLCADLRYTAYGNTLTIEDSQTDKYFFVRSSNKYLEYYSNAWQFFQINNTPTSTQNGYVRLKIYKSNVSYSNYVTNCCALAPATNLTVSATTANSATLTWTAPSPTTGITKLQVRDENGNVKVDNLAANATTATITELSECAEYTFCIASVGDECELTSQAITAQPFSGAKTVNYNYNGGTGSPSSFTTSCENQKIILPNATRPGYTFNGWFDAASGGNLVGVAGAEYNPATSPITLYAQWTETNYALTHNGSNYTNTENKTTIKSSETPLTLNYTCTGDYGLPATISITGGGKSWTVGTDYTWEVAADRQSAILVIKETVISANVTITINVATRYTVTFIHNDKGVFTGSETLEVLSSENIITLPTITEVSCGFYDTFEGWIVADDEYNESTSKPAGTIYTGGANYTVNGDCTLRALYSKCEGDNKEVYVKVIENLDDWSGSYLIINEAASVAMDGSKDNTSLVAKDNYQSISIADHQVASNSTTDSYAFTIAPHTTVSGKYSIKSYSGYYIGSNSSSNTINATETESTYSNSITITDGILTIGCGKYKESTEYRLMYMPTGSGAPVFKYYPNTQGQVCLYKKGTLCTKYYSTNPSCEKPVGVHIVYNANAVDASMSCSTQDRTYKVENEVNKYPQLASQLQFCTNATREGYTLVGWNTQSNGQGTTYNINQNYYNLPVSGELDGDKWITLNLYAMWKPCVKFNLGNATGGTGVPDAVVENGECILPTPTAEQLGTIPCGYEFYAWSETSVNATQTKPALLMPGDTYTGSALTLYAVYRWCEGNTGSDTYYFTFIVDSKTYCITRKHDSYNRFVVAEQSTGLVFGLENGYLYYLDENGVKNYVYYEGSSTTVTTTTTYPNNERYKTTFVDAGDGTTIVQPAINNDNRTLQFTGTGFLSDYYDRAYYTAGGTNPTLVEIQSSTCTYATNPTCYTNTNLHFVTNGGTLNYPTDYDETDYQELAPGSTVLLPTATFAGEWIFEGWKRGSQLESQTIKPYDPSFYPVTLNSTQFEVDDLGDIYFYAVYSKTNDDKQFDPVNGGTYKLFAIGADGTKTYMPVWTGKRGAPSGVTTCAETGDYTITPGTGTHAGQYQITCGEYTLGVVSGNTDLNEVEGTWWNIEPSTSGKGTWRITVVGSTDDRALSCSFSVAKSFGNYAISNINSPTQTVYRDMEIGECIYTEYTSTPENTPYITITGAPVKITSANGERVYAPTTLHIEAHNFTGERIIHLSATNGFGVDPVQVRTNGQGVYSGNVKVYYEPTINGDGQTITTSVLTATQTGGTNAEKISQTFAAIQGRNIPANFVIAAKWDGHWYALPANCTSSLSSTEGLLIEVDDVDNPTVATTAPASAKYGLREVIPSRQTDHGQGVVFTERFAEGDKQFALYNGSDANIQVNAQYANYAQTNPDKYEWIPSTSDFKDYTLTNASTGRNLGLTSGTFGAYTAASNQVRLLPATFYEPASAQVLKWKANSVIVMYTGTETTATTQVGDNAKSAEQTLANQQLTHGIYELTTNQALTAHAGGELNIYIGTNTRVELEIPLIISGEVTASANAHDVVILENSKLTAATTKYSYKDVYVYGGGKLAIPDGAQLGVNNIILRAGGVATDGAGQNATYQYIYPQVELKGTLTSAVQNIRYEYVTDNDHWYHLVLPFDGSLASIHYPYEYYGDQVKLDNRGSWIIKRYAGEIRATGNYDAWKDIEEDEPKATTVTAGKGYIYWGAPKKITANDVYDRPTWGIQRITMSVSAPDAMNAENGDKAISELSSYANIPNKSDKDNDQGWNLIGNPYMVNLTDMSTAGLHACKLVEVIDPATGKWNGQWEWNDDTNIRYLTIPSDHFDTYTAKTVTQAVPLVPGRAFFIQLEGEANSVTFSAANRASLLAARVAANEPTTDIETGIVLSNETMQDEVNFWIKDGKTNDYEYNADYPKTPNNNQFNIYGVHTNGDLSWVATGPEYAAESMPIGYQVPAAGTYMLSLSEIYNSDGLEALYITDHALSPEVTVDIMSEPYEFSVNQAETNNERFTVSVKVKEMTESGTTGVDNVGTGDEQIHKFIYQDKIYILHHGVIYDATGKRVITINK